MRKATVFLLFIAAFSIFAVQTPPEVVEIVEAYKTALDSKNIDGLAPHLADDFDFSGAGPELSKTVFEQVLAMGVLRIGKISQIDFERIEDNARVVIHTEIIVGDMSHDSMDEFELVLRDGVWKISGIGTGAMRALVIQDPLTDMTFSIEGPAFSELKFKESHDHIIVSAMLSGGEEVNFVIDNGTPISIIDSRIASRFAPLGDIAIAEAIGVGGDIENTGAVTVDSIVLGEIQVADLMAITMDLSHLSDALDVEITGLLGTDFLAKFAWTIDYSGRKLFLSRVGEDGALLDPNDRILAREPAHIIGFDREMHLLWTVAQFAPNVSASVILDCGAGGGVITPELFERLPEMSFEPAGKDTLLGADGKLSEVMSIIPSRMTIGPVTRGDYRVVVSDLSHINAVGLSTPVSAIVGYNFFEDWLITTRFHDDIIELRPIPK